RRAFARICETTQVHALVTDTDADPEAVRAFEAAGVEVQVV
ncbi:MAG: DeoR family transcriptional regulator, aga operon transcriptional repressor, partial [Actinomycetota bacterium]|nr:DeoR family transcriptional regulator, aga operon transcriptional repressor [Actinomycetota bacterium]